jgi:hypothetical protein
MFREIIAVYCEKRMKQINKPGIKTWNALMSEDGNRHNLCVTVEFEMLLAAHRKCLLHKIMVAKQAFCLIPFWVA